MRCYLHGSNKEYNYIVGRSFVKAGSTKQPSVYDRRLVDSVGFVSNKEMVRGGEVV